MPVYINHADIIGLRKLKGVGKAIAREIIKTCQQVGGRLKSDDIKGIVRILAATWQQWFDGGGELFLILLHNPDHPISHQTHHLINHDISHQIRQYDIHQPNLHYQYMEMDLMKMQSQGPHSSHHSVTTPHEEVGVGGHEDEQSSGLTLGAEAMGHRDGQSPRQPPRQSPKPCSRKGQRQDTGPRTSSPAGSPARSTISESLSRISSMSQQMDNLKRENASLLRRNKQLVEKCQQDQKKSADKEKKEVGHIQQLTKECDMMEKELVATQQHQQEEMRRLASSHKQKIEDKTKAEAQKNRCMKK